MDKLLADAGLPSSWCLVAFLAVLLILAILMFAYLEGNLTKSSPIARGASLPTGNYGNHVGINHGTITQLDGSTTYASALALGEEKELTINGCQFRGQVVERKAGRLFVDGRDVTDEVAAASGQLNIVVQGDVAKLVVQGVSQVTVTGNAGDVTSTAGRIEIKGNVGGSVESISGAITCGPVSGDVHSVNGTISTR